jgi:hypothetical protein
VQYNTTELGVARKQVEHLPRRVRCPWHTRYALALGAEPQSPCRLRQPKPCSRADVRSDRNTGAHIHPTRIHTYAAHSLTRTPTSAYSETYTKWVLLAETSRLIECDLASRAARAESGLGDPLCNCLYKCTPIASLRGARTFDHVAAGQSQAFCQNVCPRNSFHSDSSKPWEGRPQKTTRMQRRSFFLLKSVRPRRHQHNQQGRLSPYIMYRTRVEDLVSRKGPMERKGQQRRSEESCPSAN